MTCFLLIPSILSKVTMPKYSEAQEKYYPYADGYCLNLVGIPISNTVPEDAALVLEALSAVSPSTLTPAYYDICLTGKSIRDMESEAMLDIIFSSYTIDNCDLMQFSFMSTLSSALTKGGDIGSSVEKATRNAGATIEKANNRILNQEQ